MKKLAYWRKPTVTGYLSASKHIDSNIHQETDGYLSASKHTDSNIQETDIQHPTLYDLQLYLFFYI